MDAIELEARIISLIITGIIVGIVVFIEVQIAKYLIRYGINYFFRMKEYYEGKNTIDEIQRDIIKQHPREEEP